MTIQVGKSDIKNLSSHKTVRKCYINRTSSYCFCWKWLV